MSRHILRPLRPAASGDAPGGPRSDLARTSATGLPPVLLESVPRRLAVAALVFAGIWGFNLVAGYIQMWLNVHDVDHEVRLFDHLVSPIFIALALGFYVLSRSRRVDTARLVFLGLTFQIVGTFGIALATIYPVFHDPHVAAYFGIPWSCVWILAYPLMVPSRPRHSAVSGLLSTGAVALAMWIHWSFLLVEPAPPIPGEAWFWILFSNLLCAAWGTLGSVMINRLGQQVHEARRLGSYQLGELLGRGGMGEVWKAKHRLLARPAAIKLIRPEVFGGDDGGHTALRRFEREAQATATLQSPHTISLFDFGVSDEGAFYYVMEYLDGIDLETLVRSDGPVEPERVIHWMIQACHSLEEAHHRGLIHRDIKPANLYTCRVGLEVDVLKVLDFGLVKRGGEGDGLKTLGQTGPLVVGTPATMAPEMAEGTVTLDGRADLYSLGCVAYTLLTGETVFTGETPLQMVLAHVNTAPVPPSQRSEMGVPPDLEEIVLACLAKRREDRPPTAAELAARLRSCADASGWTPERARHWWELHRPSTLGSGQESTRALS